MRCKVWHILLIGTLVFFACSGQKPLFAEEEIKPPYSIHQCLLRGEELFRANNYNEALVFYYEAMQMVKDSATRGKLHFRIGECLEAIRRFEFATWNYQQSVKYNLPDLLASRVVMKLEHLPELAQKEEATRLFNKAMRLYRSRNIREAIDDYLASLRLMPSLMAKDESGLIEDAVKYLTFLSESKDREPDRLLKLATLLELRGDTEKAVETFQQILIIYPDSDEALQAEEKLARFDRRRTAYVEPVEPRNALNEVAGTDAILFEDNFEFRSAGTISRELENCAFTFRAINENNGIPANRFEIFSVTLGKGAEQRDFLFTAEEGIEQNSYTFSTSEARYSLTFAAVNLTRGYIQDLYGGAQKPVSLFSSIRVQLKVERLAY
jgi:Flp pilus assembly protein TadD